MTDNASPEKNSSRPSATARRNAARLMAVQAIYQMSVNNKEALFVVDEYLHLRKNMIVEGETMIEPDADLFNKIVLGVKERQDDIGTLVAAHRQGRTGQRAEDEPLLLSVLLCGSYELLAHQDTDAPIIISSYVDVAKAFFSGNEPGFINGILDSVRKTVRA